MATSLPVFDAIPKAFAVDGLRNVIPTNQQVSGDGKASLSTGFPAENSIAKDAGGIPPFRGDLNAALYLATQFGFFAQCGGVFTFNPNVSTAIGGYANGAILSYSDTSGEVRLVKSNVNNNTANFVSDPTQIGDATKPWSYVTGLSTTIPTGTVMPFAGVNAPSGYLFCDGETYPTSSYASLYSVIGRQYSQSGDASTLFRVPDLRGRFIQGYYDESEWGTVGKVKEAGLPNIEGVAGASWCSNTGARYASNNNGLQMNGCFYRINNLDGKTYLGLNDDSVGWNDPTMGFDASLSSSVYGNSDTVQPPAVVMNYIIKY